MAKDQLAYGSRRVMQALASCGRGCIVWELANWWRCARFVRSLLLRLPLLFNVFMLAWCKRRAKEYSKEKTHAHDLWNRGNDRIVGTRCAYLSYANRTLGLPMVRSRPVSRRMEVVHCNFLAEMLMRARV